MKTWNLGNTTVRNPGRIKAGLQTFATHFEGKEFNAEALDAFYQHLLDDGVVVGNPAQKSSRAISAGKWAAVFNQLGLARAWGRRGEPIEITESGKALLNDAYLDEEIFLRQLLKIQLPSPLDRGSRGFSVHPMYVMVRSALEMARRGYDGLTQEEIALFLVTTTKDEDVPRAVGRIIAYRQERELLSGNARKRRFYLEQRNIRVREVYADLIEPRMEALTALIEGANVTPGFLETEEGQALLLAVSTTGKGPNVQSAREARRQLVNAILDGEPTEAIQTLLIDHFVGRRGDTLNEYADTAIRYSRSSGLFSVNGDKLVLKEGQMVLAEQLTVVPPPILESATFLPQFYNPSLPELPSDKMGFLTTEVRRLKERAYLVGLEEEVVERDMGDWGVRELKAERQRLESEILQINEIQFSINQAEQVDDIYETFVKLHHREIIGGSDYHPAIAEWAVWRAFLAVGGFSNVVSETRNFQIDTELQPVHHARSGVADMIFEYEPDTVLLVETTLATGDRQYNMEGEPVQTHVLHKVDENPDKRVIGVLVAPVIHPRTAHAYLHANDWSDRTESAVTLDIVPLTVPQMLSLLPGKQNGCTNEKALLGKLQEMLSLRNGCMDGREWLYRIDSALHHPVAISRTIAQEVRQQNAAAEVQIAKRPNQTVLELI